MTTSTDPTTTVEPATDIDLLAALAAARLAGCPEPTNCAVEWGRRASVQVQDSDEAGVWTTWWSRTHGVTEWGVRHSRHGAVTHHYRTSQWRGAELKLVYLTHEHPSEVPA